MTLGEFKGAGRMPSLGEIWYLEREASKNCGGHFGYPHIHHVTSASAYVGMDKTCGIVCPEIERLHNALEKMFPDIKIERYKGWKQ